MIRKLSLWGPVILYMGIIFYVSAQSEVTIPAGLSDKSGHSLAYTLLGALMLRALAGGFRRPVTFFTVLTAIVLTIAYGASDEIHQIFVPGRTADLNDLAADAIGGSIGAIVCWLCGILLPSPTNVEGTSRHGL